MKIHAFGTLTGLFTMCALVVSACSSNPASAPTERPADPAAPGAAPAPSAAEPAKAASVIAIDGSSTVFPITEAVAEEFQKANPAKVTIGVSGTGGGFKKFCAGEVAIAGASRPIKPTEEQACAAAKIEYIELPVAYDGLAVVVHPENTWAKTLTVAELKKLWEPAAQGKVTKWSQLRTGFPDKEIHLFGAGVDSGTYDYFTKAIVGEEHASRGDFTSSEDDNVLVQGVSRDPLALGFFGFAYFDQNRDKLSVVAIDDEKDDEGKGPIAPSHDSVRDGTYQPLARPIFIYVSKQAAARPELTAFIEYYMMHGEKLSQEAHYIPLPAKAYELAKARFTKGVTGSMFAGAGSQVGVTVEALLARE
jgi:phosphate transport system substrate-binding protein